MRKEKPVLWLFISALDHPDLCYALPTTAWIAEEMGVTLECYLECERQGNLFAQTGSTVLGGHHHQQFNYLHALFDVRLLVLGEQTVFASSAAVFGDEVIVRADDLDDYYRQLLAIGGTPACALLAPRALHVAADAAAEDYGELMHNAPKTSEQVLDIAPYLHAEIYFRKALAYPAGWAALPEGMPAYSLWMNARDGVESIEHAGPHATYGSLTLGIAARWKGQARAVAFGDPDAIRAQLPALCREGRVSVFAPVRKKPARDIVLAGYTENHSAIAHETARLALEVGDPILVGRQTGDADLFVWGGYGVSIKIMDPNRPAFPVVDTVPHPWVRLPGDLWEEEPDDGQLRRWAREGRVLSSLLFHSGEMAHNEAMLNLVDLCSSTGLKLGIGAHLARYETCPQQWELLQIPVSRGGVRGRIEPVLHSGGLGVMAEADCPPERLAAHCGQALAGIREIAGDGGTPVGYYFFCDTDLDTLGSTRPALYQAVADAGLAYAISSARPGRNRLLDGPIPVLTQTSRTQCQGSPFVRITTREDIRESGYQGSPGWFIGVLDAPVISFSPYIWRKGSRFMDLVDLVCNERMINVLPRTIARYACILREMGVLPS